MDMQEFRFLNFPDTSEKCFLFIKKVVEEDFRKQKQENFHLCYEVKLKE